MFRDVNQTGLASAGLRPARPHQRLRPLRRRISDATAIAIASVVVVSGCGAGEGQQPNSNAKSRLTYLTGLGLYGQESYMWLAQKMGFFDEAGLEVRIQPGQGSGPNLRMLREGRADFAAVDSSGAAIEYAAGRGQDWRMVAAIHQKTALCISSITGRGIDSPRDLAGRTVGYVAGGANHALAGGYAARAGIDLSTTKWVRVDGQQLPAALASGRIDAVTHYTTSTGSLEAAARRPAVTFPYSTYLPDLYGNALATSTRTIGQRPEVVRAFVDAVVRGLRYAIGHPDEAGEVFAEYHPGYKARIAAAETRLVRAHALGPDGAVGTFDRERFKRAMAVLHGLGFDLSDARPEDLVAFDMAAQR